ncbi:iron transporter [Modestobacter muralis]|uniref:Iron transporter n=1 Tax=Modestobacter muralis TaxID=1608614 RepID=A0A6P0EQ19_9ACTN|nr:iron uptake transporter permease EfeU [Modestobacter muralis]NEK93841.1 iron transporter [Modestobacter muralis]NEN50608.1 iron transporter [Modestobacter muralis]
MGQVFAASYLIGLREGLEMVLIVSVLVAYLVKTGRRRHLLPVWAGVGAAAALSIGFGWALSYVSTTVLGGPGQELFDAVTSTIAVVLVTWMVFWMRRTARRLSGELRGKLDGAIGLGVGAVVGIAFLSVAREGLETTLLFFASAQGATTAAPLLGLGAGLLTAVVVGFGLYAGAIRINLSRFFMVSGALLVVVAAGILKYAVHDFQEAGVLPGLSTLAFDASGWLDPGSWYGALAAGLFNITPQPTVLETIAWIAYLVPVLVLFLLPSRKPAGVTTPAPNVVSETTEHVEARA